MKLNVPERKEEERTKKMNQNKKIMQQVNTGFMEKQKKICDFEAKRKHTIV